MEPRLLRNAADLMLATEKASFFRGSWFSKVRTLVQTFCRDQHILHNNAQCVAALFILKSILGS